MGTDIPISEVCISSMQNCRKIERYEVTVASNGIIYTTYHENMVNWFKS
jgi:hypothetical protein